MLVGKESQSCTDCWGGLLSMRKARLSCGYRGKEGAKALLGVSMAFHGKVKTVVASR